MNELKAETRTLRVISTDPFNAEAPLAVLAQPITAIEDFYIRNNFAAPVIESAEWRLAVRGCVGRMLELDLNTLQSLPVVSRRITLECAGNGRLLMTPATPGTKWGLGATGTAIFTGVALRDVLALVAPAPAAVDCVFTGADSGDIEGYGHIRFQRGLPIEIATSNDPIIAWEMNGAPLSRDHGFPVRLVVPRYYAVASVKWLVDVEIIDRPFHGHFQGDRYVYRVPGSEAQPVTTMRVRSLITSHTDGQHIAGGELWLEGVAWSGDAEITRVQVQIDDDAWQDAELEPSQAVGVMTRWRCLIGASPGTHAVRARATDHIGATQPLAPPWNELGYGNNVVHTILLTAQHDLR